MIIDRDFLSADYADHADFWWAFAFSLKRVSSPNILADANEERAIRHSTPSLAVNLHSVFKEFLQKCSFLNLNVLGFPVVK